MIPPLEVCSRCKSARRHWPHEWCRNCLYFVRKAVDELKAAEAKSGKRNKGT
jgi:hypothetical protein